MQRAKASLLACKKSSLDGQHGHNCTFGRFLLCASLASMNSDLPRCCPLYSIISYFPGLSCHFRLSPEPQKSHSNPQILLNMTMCHSSWHRAACFERGAEGKYICTTVNSVNNNSFGAFSTVCEI